MENEYTKKQLPSLAAREMQIRTPRFHLPPKRMAIIRNKILYWEACGGKRKHTLLVEMYNHYGNQ